MIELNCTSCKKYQAPHLNDKNQVICSECGDEIKNVSHFTKIQMKTLKQVLKSKKQAFSVRCVSCKKESLPKLNNNKLVCSNCLKDINVSKPFELMIRDALKKAGNDD